MTGSATSAPLWYRRPKRSWHALHALERTGWILFACSSATMIAVSLTHEFWVKPLLHDPAQSAAITRRIHILLLVRTSASIASSLSIMLALIGHRRALAIVARHRFLRCPGCTYDLAATPRLPTCPECGRAFGPKGFVREWARILPRRGRRWRDPLAIARHPEDAR